MAQSSSDEEENEEENDGEPEIHDEDSNGEDVLRLYEAVERDGRIDVQHIATFNRSSITGYQHLAQKIHSAYLELHGLEDREYHYINILRPWPGRNILYIHIIANKVLMLNPMITPWKTFIEEISCIGVHEFEEEETASKEIPTYLNATEWTPFKVTEDINGFDMFFRALHLHLAACTGEEADDHFSSRMEWKGCSFGLLDTDSRHVNPPLTHWFLAEDKSGIHVDLSYSNSGSRSSSESTVPGMFVNDWGLFLEKVRSVNLLYLRR